MVPPRSHPGLARFARAAALAALALGVARAGVARAEIVDFNPSTDTVPELLSPDERSLLETATTIDVPFFLTEPNPGGTLSLAFIQQEPVFIDLATGDQTPFDVMPPGLGPGAPDVFEQNLAWRWVDDETLVTMVLRSAIPGEDMPPVVSIVRVTLRAADGTWSEETVDALSDVAESIRGFSPDFEQALILERAGGGSMPASVPVTLGGSPFAPRGLRDALPASAPGVWPAQVLGTEAVQQAAFVLALVDVASGGKQPLAGEFATGTSVGPARWSADGSRLAFLTRTIPDWDGDRQRNNTPPAEGLPNLGSIHVREALGLVRPEDNPLVTGTALHVFDRASGAVVKRIDNRDVPQGLLADLDFAPRGGRSVLTIALRSELDGRAHPTYAFPSGIERRVLDAAFNVERTLEGDGFDSLSSDAAWADGDTLIVQRPSGVHRAFVSVDAGSGEQTVWWDQPGTAYQAFVRPFGAAMLFTSVDAPPELIAWGDLGVAATQPSPVTEPTLLTEVNFDASELAAQLRAEPVAWTAADGAALTGVIVHRAADAWPPAEPAPLVVWQAGGPGGQMALDYGGSVEAPYSVLPHFGLPVLIANAAGRTADSRASYDALADGRNFGQVDIDQLKAGVDSLVRSGIADPRRLGITGCSYGGYFTLQSLRRYPDLYAAGNAQCSLTDLTEEFTFGYTPVISYLMGRTPFADIDEFLQDSPFYGSKDITAPTLLFHGTDDFLPVPLLNNIHDQLAANGTDVTFLRVAGEGHGFGSPDSQAYAGQLQIEFFRTQLLRELPPLPKGGRIFLPTLMRSFDAASPEG